MTDKTFACTVITPERTALSAQATFAAIPAHDGEIGILYDRAPLLCKLGIGVLRLESPGGQQHFFIDGGFAQVLNNTVTLLTENASSAKDIDVESARALEREARQRRAVTPEELESRRQDLARAAAQLKAASAA